MTRKLQAVEITKILDSVFKGDKLPLASKIKKAKIKILRKQFEAQLKDIIIYPQMIPKLCLKLKMNYEKSKMTTGECVGVIMAQSIGENSTQQTLNTFHSAGIAIGTVVTGIPKLCELLNTTHNPKSRMCQVFCTKNKSISMMRNHIKYSLVELTLEKLKTKVEIHHSIPDKPWYKIFKCIYPEKFILYPCCISFHLDKKLLIKYSLPLERITEKINALYSDINAIFSPLYEATIDIFVDIENIELVNNENTQITNDNKIDIYIKDIVMKKLREIILCGIPGIKNMFFQKKQKKWMILTEGSNLIKLLKNPIFNPRHTISNDMWEIYTIFGIEATREFLIEEFIKIITEDGTFINNCHIYLLVDIMTFKGYLFPVSRYGMKRDDFSPISKAAFEETLTNFLNAGLLGLEDKINGISAAILCGNMANIGTGCCDLKLKN